MASNCRTQTSSRQFRSRLIGRSVSVNVIRWKPILLWRRAYHPMYKPSPLRQPCSRLTKPRCNIHLSFFEYPALLHSSRAYIKCDLGTLALEVTKTNLSNCWAGGFIRLQNILQSLPNFMLINVFFSKSLPPVMQHNIYCFAPVVVSCLHTCAGSTDSTCVSLRYCLAIFGHTAWTE